MKFFWKEDNHTKLVAFGSKKMQAMLYNNVRPIRCEVTYEEAENHLNESSTAEHLAYYQHIKNVMQPKSKLVMVDKYSEKLSKK